MKLSQMVRAAVIVEDLNRSVDFYENILGLREVYFEGELNHPAGAKLLAMPEATSIRAKILKAPGPAFGMIGLFELTNPEPPHVKRNNETSNIGEACQVYYCDDLDEIYDKLVQGGHTVVCPPTFLKVGNRTGQREMVFRDPDGAMINLIEWDFESDRDPIEEH